MCTWDKWFNIDIACFDVTFNTKISFVLVPISVYLVIGVDRSVNSLLLTAIPSLLNEPCEQCNPFNSLWIFSHLTDSPLRT